ncbi:hypothetical protein [Roseococcus sp. YIM B11640]|uniref:hypothetical protein n=1 Tax=Roseococcus sp. YIM B11640 TaxID=3133973 RepID=UPI003C7B17A4
MALVQPLEINDTGIAAAYWRLTHLQFDRIAGVLEAQLHGYRDEAARRAGKAPLHRLGFRFDQDAMEEPGHIGIDALYRAIRQQPAGTDAEGRPLPSLFADAADA